MDKFEIRSYEGVAAPKVTGRTIEGYAIVFNVESRVMLDPAKKRFFIETIEPGSITEDLIKRSDIRALSEHNRERMLARSYNGEGTLQLTIDDVGLKYRFEAPNTPDGNYNIEMINRGDIFGSSFAFWSDEKKNVAYEKRSDGMLLRRVKKIDLITDVSIVSKPAYMQTSVAVRSLDEYFENQSDYKYKEEINELRDLIKI